MTQNTVTQMDELEIKRFLFGEMSDEERDSIEEELFENDELFYEIADLENQLVDLYARKKLFGEELVRFERSLANLPERRTKVANAVALQTLIDDERPPEKAIEVPVATTIWQKIADLFKVNTMAFGYAMGGLLILFALSSILLLLENRRRGEELSRLQGFQANQKILQQRQTELETQLADSQKRESELASRNNDERGDLIEAIENERQQREKIQDQLKALQKERDKVVPTPTKSNIPTIATILLTPFKSSKGGGTNIHTIAVERETKRLALSLILPEDTDKDEKFSVQLNGKTVLSNLMPRGSGNQKFLYLTIVAQDLIADENNLSAIDKTGNPVSRYKFNVQKK